MDGLIKRPLGHPIVDAVVYVPCLVRGRSFVLSITGKTSLAEE